LVISLCGSLDSFFALTLPTFSPPSQPSSSAARVAHLDTFINERSWVLPTANPTSRPKIIISGLGLVSPLGHSAWETFSALLAGKTISDRSTDPPHPSDPVEWVRQLGCVSIAQHTATDPAIELAERAAREALSMAGIPDPQGMACIIGVSKGATHAWVTAIEHRSPRSDGAAKKYRNHLRTKPPPDADLALSLGPYGYLSHHLKQRLGVNPTHTTVAACASSLTALHQARAVLEHNPIPITNEITVPPADVDKKSSAFLDSQRGNRIPDGYTAQHGRNTILVITAEASLLPLFIHSYRRLGVTPPLTPTQYVGRPLDHRRNGFMLAEMAAAVILETVDQILPGQIELVDTAIANEAYDLVRPPPAMEALSHIAQSLLADRHIDMLHPHATGTVHHDPAELSAVAPHLHNQPDGYACKGALGHGLGAAGLVSLVIACLCAKTQRRPPMPWLNEPLDTNTVKLNAMGDTLTNPQQTHAVFAAGFGGHVAGAVIRSH